MTGGDVDSPAEIAQGEGAIVRRGLAKLAVYRDDKGTLYGHSAVCSHLGCIVSWNSVEKTWTFGKSDVPKPMPISCRVSIE